ncbi:hypothetical protein ACWGH5_37915 [Streptomyces sp. NPDC054864]
MQLRVCGAAMAVVAAIAVAPGSAFAADTASGWDHVFTATGVKVYVEENGDKVRVCDTSANGVGATAAVFISSQLQYTLKDSKSGGSCASTSASDGAWWNLPEGDLIDIAYDGNGGASAYAQYRNDH